MTTSRLLAGVAELDITCQVGSDLAAELNHRVSSDVRTPLMAKAVALSDGVETLALVMLDLFGLGQDVARQLTSAIVAQSGLNPEAIMVVCSHTRAGPYTTQVVGWPDVDTGYVSHLVSTVPLVVGEALDRLAPAALGAGHATLPHLVYNHRMLTRNLKAVSAWMGIPRDEVLEPEGPIDSALRVLVLRDGHGRPVCLLWNLAADNRFSSDDCISADLPYYVQEAVDERIGRHVPCLYVGGCGGDVSYTHDLAETTDGIASGVMAVQLETPCDPTVKLGGASEDVILPIRDYAQFWSRADIELKAPDALDAFAREVELLQEEGAHAVPATVQAFRLGRFALVGFPGMPFAEYALATQDQSPFQSTVVASNAGGYVGYVSPRRAFLHQGFETWPARSSKVGPGGGEFMVERAVNLLKGLAAG